MRRNRHIIRAVAILLLPIFASCRQELCYDHFPSADISFSYEQEWERDYGRYHLGDWNSQYYGFDYNALRPRIPEWVTMVRYTGDEELPDERFLRPDGSKIIVSGKEGSILFYNGDTEYIVLSDMASLYAARASATSRSRSSAIVGVMVERHPNARTTNSPDILYSAFLKDVPAISNHEVRAMPVKMQPLVYTYVVRYEFEYGLQHVSQARGALGGMAESVYLRDGTTSEESAIILYDCALRPFGCEAHVRSFGIPGFPDEYYGRSPDQPDERPYTLNLELQLKNGKTLEFNFDISDQMANQPRGGVITVSGLRVEDEENQSASGFDVDVSDWGEHEVIDLPVGTEETE